MDIWQFQNTLTQRLILWVWASITLGILFFLPNNDFWIGMAFQFFGWALVNLAIALFGKWSLRRRLAKLTASEKHAAAPEETRNLANLLWINMALDVVYMLGGVLLVSFMASQGKFWQGTGTGIFIQGAFLFFFDWFHARKLQ